MRIDNTTQLENPTITLSWSWQNPNIIVSAMYENERNSFGRQIGLFTYINGWIWQPNEGNTTDVNEYFKDLAIEDLNIENLTYYQPPTLYGLGVVIPEMFLWVFPDNKFILEGFEILLTTKENYLIMDKAYIEWDSFREELKNTEKESAYKIINIIFNYLDEQVKNNNIIEC